VRNRRLAAASINCVRRVARLSGKIPAAEASRGARHDTTQPAWTFACSPDRRVHNGLRIGQQDFVNYPTGVRRALVAADESCRRAGGTRGTLTVNAVRRLDLNGDGRDDYIVDFHETECGGRASFFCGTGGCDLLILVAQRGGALRKIFDDRVRGYEILSGRGPAKSASYSMVHIAAVTAIHHAKKRDASRQSRSNSNNQTSEDNSAAVLLCLADSGGSA
jgi:hypothetical protein